MSVTRSIVYGVVGLCKTESSQKPVPIPPILANALLQWKKGIGYTYRADLRSRGEDGALFPSCSCAHDQQTLCDISLLILRLTSATPSQGVSLS
jgi:hypothetical protein